MDILFVRNLFRPADFGGNRYPFEVTRRLATRHSVRVVTPRLRGKLPGQTSVVFRHYFVSLRTPLETFLTNALFSRAAVEREIRRRRPDVIVFSSYDVAYAYFRLFPHHIPSAYIYHSSFYSPAVDRVALKPFPIRVAHHPLRGFMTLVERTVFERADGMIAVSPFSRREIEQRLGRKRERLVVIPTGVDTDLFSPGDRDAARRDLGLSPSQIVLATVGRLAPVKQYGRAIDTVDLLRDRGVDAILLIAGSGPAEATLRTRASTSHSSANVRFLGFVDGAKLVSLYRAADVVLNTSDFENWSLAMLEALACGAPVVATPRGGSPDMLRMVDPALVASGVEPYALADAVERSLVIARTRDLRSEAHHFAASRFSWQVTVTAVEQFLAEIASASY